MIIRHEYELQALQRIGKITGIALNEMVKAVKPGISTLELDRIGSTVLQDYGARSAPRLVYKFPAATCISVNHEVAHGIPSAKTILKEGDLVNIDVSAELNGYFGDNGCSVPVMPAPAEIIDLCIASRDILLEAITNIVHNMPIRLTGQSIQEAAKLRGYTVLHDLVGHGIGRNLHEQPDEIPNFDDPWLKKNFVKGMVVAVETFISTKAQRTVQQKDGWTLCTPDGSLVAQHEHTLVVTENEPLILTASNGIDQLFAAAGSR